MTSIAATDLFIRLTESRIVRERLAQKASLAEESDAGVAVQLSPARASSGNGKGDPPADVEELQAQLKAALDTLTGLSSKMDRLKLVVSNLESQTTSGLAHVSERVSQQASQLSMAGEIGTISLVVIGILVVAT